MVRIHIDNHHDSTNSKLLLNGVTLPAELGIAEHLLNDSNVGPFISKQLIERLVTSNPSPDYVGRVAAGSADNGSGVRGDLKAVVTAIGDPEARADDPAREVSEREPKEPVLFITNRLL